MAFSAMSLYEMSGERPSLEETWETTVVQIIHRLLSLLLLLTSAPTSTLAPTPATPAACPPRHLPSSLGLLTSTSLHLVTGPVGEYLAVGEHLAPHTYITTHCPPAPTHPVVTHPVVTHPVVTHPTPALRCWKLQEGCNLQSQGEETPLEQPKQGEGVEEDTGVGAEVDTGVGAGEVTCPAVQK